MAELPGRRDTIARDTGFVAPVQPVETEELDAEPKVSLEPPAEIATEESRLGVDLPPEPEVDPNKFDWDSYWEQTNPGLTQYREGVRLRESKPDPNLPDPMKQVSADVKAKQTQELLNNQNNKLRDRASEAQSEVQEDQAKSRAKKLEQLRESQFLNHISGVASTIGTIAGGLPSALGRAKEGLRQGISAWLASGADKAISNLDRMFIDEDEAQDPESALLAINPEEKEKIRAELNESRRENLKAMVDASLAGERYPLPPEVEAFFKTSETGDLSQAWDKLTEAPVTILTLGMVSMLGHMAPGLAMAAAGTGPLGYFAGSAGHMYAVTILESLQRHRVDVTNYDALDAAFRDEEIMASVQAEAATYGTIVGAFDAASFHFASKLLPGAPQFAAKFFGGSSTAREMANIGMQMPLQAGLGASGEAAGSYAAYGEINPVDVFMEGIFEVPGAFVEVPFARSTGVARDSEIESQEIMKRIREGGVVGPEGVTPPPLPEAAPETEVEATEPDVDPELEVSRSRADAVIEQIEAADAAPGQPIQPPPLPEEAQVEEPAPAVEEAAAPVEEAPAPVEEVPAPEEIAPTPEEGLAIPTEQETTEAGAVEADPRDQFVTSVLQDDADRLEWNQFASQARKDGDLDLQNIQVTLDYVDEQGNQASVQVSAKEGLDALDQRMRGISQLVRCLG